MSVFESRRKQTEEPRRTTPPKLQPTVGHDPLAKNISKYGSPCPLYANLTECLSDVDFTQHDTSVRSEPPTQVQNAPNDISQHAAQRHGGGLFKISISVDTVCVLRQRKRQIVNDPGFRRRYNHGQRRQPQSGNGVRFAALRCAEKMNARPNRTSSKIFARMLSECGATLR